MYMGQKRQLDELQDRRRARKGAALLDKHIGPDWRHKIDSEILDIDRASRCILGQTLGFSDGCERLGIHGSDCYSHGFIFATRALHEEWRRIVAEAVPKRKRSTRALALVAATCRALVIV